MTPITILDSDTSDITEENISKIIELFPQVATEVEGEDGEIGRTIDFDALKDLLGDVAEGQRERYQFTWPGKRKAKAEARRPIDKTMIPCPEKSVDWDTTENLYIEGDNLDALKLLRETYAGQIKLIYIDPPYNTGHDFIYDDDFSLTLSEYESENGEYDSDGGRLVANQESNGRFHSDWCSMIYPRILLSRDLLTQDGVIFISINDSELSNLLNICDGIFGQHNRIGIFTVEINPKGRKNSRFISVSSDYCVAYAKNTEDAYFVENIPKDAASLSLDSDGVYVHNSGKRVLVGDNTFNKKSPGIQSPKHYTVYFQPTAKKVELKKETETSKIDEDLIAAGYERYASIHDNHFLENTYTESKFLELFLDNLLEFKNGKIYEKNTSTTIRIKSVLVNRKYEAIINNAPEMYELDFKTTSAGTAQKNLFETEELVFPAPKNTGLLKLLITLLDGNDFTCLDYFSGSGTMAHAVMEVNANDGGNRKIISVQYPEKINGESFAATLGYKTIVDIGEERIRRAGKKITLEIEESNSQLKLGEDPKHVPDIGFRVLRVGSSNFKNHYTTPDETDQSNLLDMIDNVKDGRTAEDLLFQVLPAFRIPYSAKINELDIEGKKVFGVKRNATDIDYTLVACFDIDVNEKVIEEIARMKPSYAIMRDLSFKNDSTASNFEELFKTFSPDTIRRVI